MQLYGVHGELWPSKKGKMLDPSGCFYFTIPGVSVICLLGSRWKLARIVANTMPKKASKQSPPNMYRMKSYGCAYAIDFRFEDAKMMRERSSGAFYAV